MRLPIVIDGVDFTPYTMKNGYRVQYIRREGVNSGLMLDGSTTIDVLAFKAVIEWDLTAMTSAQFSNVCNACIKNEVTVTFFDPKTNAERTAVFFPTLGQANYAFSRHNLHYFRDGAVLTLEEK